MDYWKSKVLPKMKLVFVKAGSKKAAAAAEVVKAFNESKEGINGEFEEKKADLQPKVVEIYEAVPAPVKILIKERKKTSAIKKNSAAVTKLFEDLAKIEFPGAKQVSEGIAKLGGPGLLSGPIFATFEKVSTLLPVAAEEQSTPKEAPPAATEEKKEEAAADDTEEKKEEAAVAAEEEKKEDAAAEAKTEEAAAEAKTEEAAPAATEPAAAEEPAPAAAELAAAEETSTAAPAADQATAAPAEAESAPAKTEEAPKAA